MRFRGRPVLGAFAGFFFGLFLALDLVLFRVITSGSILMVVLPLVGLVGGLVLGLMGPLGRERIARQAVMAEGSAPGG